MNKNSQLVQEPVLLEDNPRDFRPFDEIFGNGNPVEVEIGCGKAKFLIARAIEAPEINFLGVDVVWKWMKYGVQRSAKRELGNIRFAKLDARELLRYGVADGSVSAFHIYFPDPWPKRRHRKRRLVTGDFLRLLHQRLVPGGLIELATDHLDYFAQMQQAVLQSGVEWHRSDTMTNKRLFDSPLKTNYEIKYETAGRTLNYLELQKQF